MTAGVRVKFTAVPGGRLRLPPDMGSVVWETDAPLPQVGDVLEHVRYWIAEDDPPDMDRTSHHEHEPLKVRVVAAWWRLNVFHADAEKIWCVKLAASDECSYRKSGRRR